MVNSDEKIYKYKLKIPYNFNAVLVDKIKDIKARHNDIEYFFYLPCSNKDGYNTRQNYMTEPASWEEYIHHIKYIKNQGFDFEVLFQQPGQILKKDVLQRYIDLGATRFTFYEDENASLLKKIDSNLYTCASITKVLRPDQIDKSILSMYDEICLFFWYNRNIKYIDNLPKDFNYSILPNTTCSANCSTHLAHWFGSLALDNAFKTIRCPYRGTVPVSFTRNDFMKYFLKNISTLKITDRTSPLQKIVDAVAYYSGDIEKIENLIEDHPKEYFNLNISFPKSISAIDVEKVYQLLNNKKDII